jgi:hypothetical protein
MVEMAESLDKLLSLIAEEEGITVTDVKQRAKNVGIYPLTADIAYTLREDLIRRRKGQSPKRWWLGDWDKDEVEEPYVLREYILGEERPPPTFNMDRGGFNYYLKDWGSGCMNGYCDIGLEWWHPADYLNALAAPWTGVNASKAPKDDFGEDGGSIDELIGKLRNETPMDPLALDVNTCSIEPDGSVHKCLGHEGRHRAYAARELGIEWVPVLVVRPKGHEKMIKPCYIGEDD